MATHLKNTIFIKKASQSFFLSSLLFLIWLFWGIPLSNAQSTCINNALVTLVSGPGTLNPGQTGTFTVRAANTGNTSWHHGGVVGTSGTRGYRLLQQTSSNITSTNSNPVNSAVIGLGYGHLPTEIDSGNSVEWTFNIVAPSITGTYSLTMRMFWGADTLDQRFGAAYGSAWCNDIGTAGFFGQPVSINFDVVPTTSTPTPTPSCGSLSCPPTPTPSQTIVPTPTLVPRPSRPAISNVRAINITNTSATIVWDTDVPADTQVELCTTYLRCGNFTSLNSSLTTSHSVNLSGLSVDTYYYLWALSRNSSGYLTVVGYVTFITSGGVAPTPYPPLPSPTPPPGTTPTPTPTTTPAPLYIYNVSYNSLTMNSVVITWVTNLPADSQVEICTVNTPCGNNSSLNQTQVVNHSVSVSGLSPNTYYYFWAKSRDASGRLTVSSHYLFRTNRLPIPTVTNFQITNLTQNSATITYLTNIPATTRLQYCASLSYTPCGNFAPTTTALGASHSITLTGLTARTYYSIWVEATDANGNIGNFGPVLFRTRRVPIPYVYYISVTNLTQNSATITYLTNIPATTRLQYCASLSYTPCGNFAPTTTPLGTSHSITLTGLTSRTYYSVWVEATDVNGNIGNFGPVLFRTR